MQAALIAVAAAALVACAPAMPNVVGGLPNVRLADIDVLDRSTGERLPVYWHDGQRWIAGAPGHRYAVSIRNRTPGRILTVVSVDGVNAVSGETADWSQRGYVLAPWESYDVLGWRKSTSAVANFVFTSPGDSYAARTGRPGDVGVIGVAVFHEAAQALAAPPAALERWDPMAQSDAAARAPNAPALAAPSPAQREAAVADEAAAAKPRLGTGHGPSETSSVAMVDFNRELDHPDEILTIRYDRYDRLLAMGVIPHPAAPQAFPGSADSGFVPDPPRRN